VGSGEITGVWRWPSCSWQGSNCGSPTPYPRCYRDCTIPGSVCILCAIDGQEDEWRMESNAFGLRTTCSYHLAVTRDLSPC